MSDKPKILKPCIEYKSEFLDMVAEFQANGDNRKLHQLAQEDFDAYLRRIQENSLGLNVRPGYVPGSVFWLVQGWRVLGQCSLRHYLTPKLQQEGGHIGYAIRPSQRSRGYGTIILSLVLEEARLLQINPVRITCDTDNVASARVIEKNKGRLSGYAQSTISDKQISQYWIDLSRTHNS